jgi:hypothetical protein
MVDVLYMMVYGDVHNGVMYVRIWGKTMRNVILIKSTEL